MHVLRGQHVRRLGEEPGGGAGTGRPQRALKARQEQVRGGLGPRAPGGQWVRQGLWVLRAQPKPGCIRGDLQHLRFAERRGGAAGPAQV